MQSTAELLNRLRQFVQSEAEAQYESLSRQWARALGERVANGWAMILKMTGQARLYSPRLETDVHIHSNCQKKQP